MSAARLNYGIPQNGNSQLPVRPVFPGLTITADGRILPVVSFSTLLQALDALKEQQAAP